MRLRQNGNRTIDVFGGLDGCAHAREQRPQRFASFRVVINHQHGNALEAGNVRNLRDGRDAWMPSRRTPQTAGGNGKRKTDSEDATQIRSVAVGGNRAAVKAYDVLDDRETQAHPAIATVRATALPEAIENIFE